MLVCFIISILLPKTIFGSYYSPQNLECDFDALNALNDSINHQIMPEQSFKNILTNINNRTDVYRKHEKQEFITSLRKSSVHFWCYLIIQGNNPQYLSENVEQMCHVINDVGLEKFNRVLNSLDSAYSTLKVNSEQLSNLGEQACSIYDATFECVQWEYMYGRFTTRMNERLILLGEIRDKLLFRIHEAIENINTMESRLLDERKMGVEMIGKINDARKLFCSKMHVQKQFPEYDQLVKQCRVYLTAHNLNVPSKKDDILQLYLQYVSKEFKAMTFCLISENLSQCGERPNLE